MLQAELHHSAPLRSIGMSMCSLRLALLLAEDISGNIHFFFKILLGLELEFYVPFSYLAKMLSVIEMPLIELQCPGRQN